MANVKGIGIDAVHISRFRIALARTPRMASRLFTAREQADATSIPDAASRYAARFAAKEAAMKALGVGLGAFAFHDVEVVRGSSGAPALVVQGAAAALASAAGVTRWWVSLTHADTVAIAVVVAE